MKSLIILNQHRKLRTATWFIIFLISCLCHSSLLLAQEKLSLSATLSKTTVAVDDTATLMITVNGSRSAEIDIPEVDNLLFHRRGQSSSMRFVNGTLSSSISTTYILQPLKEGTFTIPSFNVSADNQILTTEPLTLEVKASSNSRGSANVSGNTGNSGDIAFLTVTELKKKGYTGEIVPVEIKAYFRRGIRVEIQRMPEIRGEAFVMSPPSDEPRQTVESHNGKSYSVITWNSSISPIKEGTYDFVVDLDATLYLPQKNNNPLINRNPFFNDDFFSDIFGGFQEKKVTLASKQQPFTSEPLPTKGRPEEFNGAVGDFNFEIDAKPKNVKVGDPITLTMKISGQGNFDRVTAPNFPENNNWKTYSPVSSFKSTGSEYSGEKIFEQAVVLNNSSIHEIPSLHFSFFDPVNHQYVTKSTKALPLAVEKEMMPLVKQSIPSADNSTQPDTASPEPQVQEATIRLSAGSLTRTIKPVFLEKWFIATAAICSLILMMTAAFILRKKYLLKNGTFLQKKKELATIQEKLVQLQKDIENNDSNAFLKNCRGIIQAKLGLEWRMEPATITLSDLQQKLPSDSPLLELFRAAEQQAYGGIYLTKDLDTCLIELKKELEAVS